MLDWLHTVAGFSIFLLSGKCGIIWDKGEYRIKGMQHFESHGGDSEIIYQEGHLDRIGKNLWVSC